MAKKIFLICFIFIFALQTSALAKDKKQTVNEIPEDKRIKIAVEVFDRTDFQDLDTSKILYSLILEKLDDTKIFSITDTRKIFGEETFGDGKIKPSEVKTLGKKKSDSDVGEMLLFNPTAEKNKSYSTEEINQNFYENLGVDYVLKCNILGLGIIHNEINSGITPGFGIGIGSRHHSYFDFGIFSSIGTSIKRNSYGVAANMELIKVDGALNIWKRNALGQSSKHRKPSKGYDDASDEAYLKSLNKTADIIVEKVASYSGRFLIKNPDAEENSKTKR